MKKFQSRSTKDGKEYGGTFEAVDEADARAQLAAQGYEVLSLAEAADEPSLPNTAGSTGKKSPLPLLGGLLLLFLIAAGILYWSYTRTPKYSLLRIKSAIQEHDLDTFKKHVDIESVVNGIFGETLTDSGIAVILKPQAADAILQQVAEYVESDSVSRKESEGGEHPSLAEVVQETIDGTQITYEGISHVTKEGKIATIGLKFFSSKNGQTIILDFKMRNKGGYWQVAQIKEFAAFSEFVSTAMNYQFTGETDKAKILLARADIKANIATALKLYELDNGSFPTTNEGLDALLYRPASAANWNGPYMESLPYDPWGNKYLYELSGTHASGIFTLFSRGKDEVAGTDDDITNKPTKAEASKDISKNESLAKSALRVLSTASETYATANNGFYPGNARLLTGAHPPYMNTNYCNVGTSGYRYKCDMTSEGYLFTATPTFVGITGSKIYTMSTGGVLRP